MKDYLVKEQSNSTQTQKDWGPGQANHTEAGLRGQVRTRRLHWKHATTQGL